MTNSLRVLSKDFQRMLFPLDLLLTVLLQPKYRIICGYITPNGIISFGFGALGVCLMIVTITCRLVFFTFDAYEQPMSYFLFKLQVFESLFYFTYIISVFILNIVHRRRIVLLISKTHHAYKVFGCSDYVQQCRKSSWIYITVYLLVSFSYLVSQYVMGFWYLSYIIFKSSLVYFDANIIYVVQIVKILKFGLKMWKKELDYFLATCLKTDHTQLRRYLDDISVQKKRLFKVYLDILGAYKLCGNLFCVPVMVLATRIFVEPLLYIQMFIELSKTQETFNLYTVTFMAATSLFAVKNFTLLVSVCVNCQQFELEVTGVDAASAIICGDVVQAEARRLCKNVSRVNRYARAAMSAPAALPLRLLALLATYIAVLLQFAFL